MSVGRSILAIFNDTDTDSNGKSSERLSADLCDKYGLSVRFLVVTEKDFMVQDSTSVTLISSWNPVRIMQFIIFCDKYSLHAFFLRKFQSVLQTKGETGGA